MAFSRFAGGAVTGTVGFFTGYYASHRKQDRNFSVLAMNSPVEPELSSIKQPQPNSIWTLKDKNITVMEYVLPARPSDERICSKFVSCYDRVHRTPNFLLEVLSKNNISDQNRKSSCRKYAEDSKIFHIFRSTLKDFKATKVTKNVGKDNQVDRNAYDMGHLACLQNYPNDERAREEASRLSMLVPQNNKCNIGAWQQLENYVLSLLSKYQYVTVISGPLYLPRSINVDKYKKNPEILKILYEDSYEYLKDGLTGIQQFMIYNMTGDIHVPTHFFKVIICEDENGILVKEGYIIKNSPISGDNFKRNQKKEWKENGFLVPIEEIEKYSGYLFTSEYMKEKAEELKDNLKKDTSSSPLKGG